MSEVSITVRGSFRSSHPPERATVRLSVGMEGATKDTVFAAASQTANAVAAQITPLFDRERGPVTWWSSDQVRTWSRRPWNQDGRQLPQVHHAGVQFEVKFSDFDVLSRWLSAVAPLTGVTIEGIDWALTEARRVQLTNEAHTAAVHDARDRAQAYAASLGLGPVRVVALADPGMLGDTAPPPGGPIAPVARFAASAAAPDGGELNFAPQDIELEAAVDARFVVG